MRYYRVRKFEDGKEIGYGSLSETDVKEVVKGYKLNSEITEIFYKNCIGIEGIYTRRRSERYYEVIYIED